MRTRSRCSVVVLLFSSCLAFANVTMAGEIKESEAGVVWQAGIDGVEIEWNPDGSFNRIYSRYTQPAAIPDRQGIAKAQIIAEEKAKAAIIRFMNQEVASARVVAEIQNDMNQTVSTKDTGKASAITKTSQRQMIENLTEVSSSAAAGKLRGVIVLERGYDEKEEIASVKVGISKKTMNVSQSLEDALHGKSAPPAGPSSQSGPTTPNNGGGSVHSPGSELQRSPQKDW
jgi:hypothetical protein